MSQPTLSGNPESFLVSPAQLLFNGTDVGFVSKVQIKIKHEMTDVKTDQAGKVIVNQFYVGDTVMVEAVLDELTAQRLSEAYPFATFITNGSASRISWGKPVGADAYSIAQQLQIRPTVDDTSYTGRNFLFYKALPVGDSTVDFSPEKHTEIKVTFHCFPDFTQPNGQWFGYFGQLAAGSLTPSTAGPATPGGSNVGNGTVGSFISNDNFTKTETWTATCIYVVGSVAHFSVVGSVTGARGDAQTGSAYFSNSITPGNSEIGFTITQGGTAFVVGDTFTIPTTVANYT